MIMVMVMIIIIIIITIIGFNGIIREASLCFKPVSKKKTTTGWTLHKQTDKYLNSVYGICPKHRFKSA